ncbi:MULTISPECIES: hypothetical protein [unclassified Streptomyces]|uniref:hypothetical protein n=1 Tax=unclassified Streptomyces TaxID=2593676 RepID=UPI00236613DA|nr:MULTISPECIES: hypothetical protein [unclassified Streptomyces]MDF3141082.1 hypothetical protein [Streptomyces sp. T21Q-yed]WDF45067.1 hypothetical protein PBV52_51115 [Streptomyces sp. T12]
MAIRVLVGDVDDDMALMLLAEDDAVVGCMAIYATTPEWGWTPSERTEVSMSVALMYTHPDQHGGHLARLMTLWVLDYAARRPDPEPKWVRCTVPNLQLARYFRDDLGWNEVRVIVDGQRPRRVQMQQRPRQMPGLSALITGDGPLLKPSVPTLTTFPVAPRQACQNPDIVTSDQGGGRP